MVSDALFITALIVVMVSIRFEVRGGFRRRRHVGVVGRPLVSIRFEVRGGFRQRYLKELRLRSSFNPL